MLLALAYRINTLTFLKDRRVLQPKLASILIRVTLNSKSSKVATSVTNPSVSSFYTLLVCSVENKLITKLFTSQIYLPSASKPLPFYFHIISDSDLRNIEHTNTGRYHVKCV